MNDTEKELKLYALALAIDSWVSRKTLAVIRRSLAFVVVFLLGVIAVFVIRDSLGAHVLTLDSVFGSARLYTAFALIACTPLGILYQLSFFYNSLYFRGTFAIHREDFDDTRGITFAAAKILSHTPHDLAGSFIQSDFGMNVLIRAGAETTDMSTYLKMPRPQNPAGAIPLREEAFLTPYDVGEFLITNDRTFKEFLFKHGISEASFKSTLAWISRLDTLALRSERWWGRDNLGKIRALGAEFSYGIAYSLQRYTRNPSTSEVFSLLSRNAAYAEELITKIETTLIRKRAANVMLVAEPGTGSMDLLIELASRMREGKSVASVTGKHLVVFDADAFSATHQEKASFEESFLGLMSEAEGAGNIMLVIDDIPRFLKNADSIGVDVGDMLGRFLASPSIQIIATTSTEEWHAYLRRHAGLLNEFQAVHIEETDLGSTIRVLEDVVWKRERAHKVFFTHPALERIAESADQYIVDGVMPDKALTLLAEVAAAAHTQRILRITPSFVDLCVRERTGIPLGPILEGERELLIHLEEKLHERVIGQDDAIKAIASTMRRARAGIQEANRPIGSFLFLGSTGVGKTETAKALAHVFFGSEENMFRLDMSEFSDFTSLERLIGMEGTSGVLASALRDHPYGVLLLDEFEKASMEVHDLFLQILDEGFFTDAGGKRVNARNTIIIATSNAGSDRIWELVRRGERPSASKDSILNTIIREKIFKPELINRFDNVVIFESLSSVQQRKIAELMLKELQERIRHRGFEFVVNDSLIAAIAKKGMDPEFGARPMRRAIQDDIEEKIALQILEKRLAPGASIILKSEDIA